MKINRLYILCWSLVAMVMMSCNPMPSKPVLSVSILPQKYFLEKIVGEKYDVQCMLSKGGNPEAYEPSLNNLMNLEKSQAYFCVGNLGFELAIMNKMKSNTPNLQLVDCSKGINLLQGTHSGVMLEGEKCEHGHSHRHEVDPHVWTSVENAKIIVENMYKSVLELDSSNKNYYTKRYEALMNELRVLECELDSILESKQGTAFAVWHPSLSYFARDYGLEQIAMECEGKEVPASVLKAEIDLAKDKNVRVLFYQKDFDNRQVQTVNEGINAQLIEINPMNYEWVEEMRTIAYAIANE